MLLNIQVVFCFLLVAYGPLVLGTGVVEAPYLKPIEVKAKKSSRKSIEVSESNPEKIEVASQQSPSLTQVLHQTPSIFVQDSGTVGAPHVVLRAQDPIENRYFLEGVPLTDAQFNADQISILNLRTVGGIDVYPDGVPSGLISDGLGGAIDFHLDQEKQEKLGLKAGNYGFGEVFGKKVLGQGDKILSLNVSRSNEDYTYYDDGGTPFNSSAGAFKNREHNRFFHAGLTPNLLLSRSKDLEIRYFGLNNFRTLEIPGAVSIPLAGKLNHLFHLSAFSLEKELSERIRTKIVFFVRFDSQKYQSEKISKSLSAPESNESTDKAIGIRNQSQFYHFFPVRIEQVIGANYEHYNLHSLEKGNRQNTNSRLDIPVSISSLLPIRSIELKPAVMFYSAFYEGVSRKQYFFVSPRLGIDVAEVAGIKNFGWHLSLGRFFRSPSMQELNGNPYGLVASSTLFSERADKISSGLYYEVTRAETWFTKAQLSYVYSLSFSKDLITYVQNSQNSQVATNVGNSFIQSHEGSLNLGIHKFTELNSKIIFLNAENLSDLPYHYGKQIPNRPKLRLVERLGFQNSSFGLAYQLQWIEERYWDLANTKKMSAIVDHSFFLNFSPSQWGRFNLEILNMFDRVVANSTLSGFQVVDNTSGYLGYPSPGRRVYLSWTYEI